MVKKVKPVRVKMTTPHGEPQTVEGFKFLWLKNVVDFDSSNHCAKSLIGSYCRPFGTRMLSDTWLELPEYEPGDVLYFCGVAMPYRHDNNLHLAGRVNPGHSCSADLYTGGELIVEGVEHMPFTSAKAYELHPDKAKAYLTCRNFQFGVHYFQ